MKGKPTNEKSEPTNGREAWMLILWADFYNYASKSLKTRKFTYCCLADDAVAVDVVHPEGPGELLVLRPVEQRGQGHQHVLKQKLFTPPHFVPVMFVPRNVELLVYALSLSSLFLLFITSVVLIYTSLFLFTAPHLVPVAFVPRNVELLVRFVPVNSNYLLLLTWSLPCLFPEMLSYWYVSSLSTVIIYCSSLGPCRVCSPKCWIIGTFRPFQQ